MKFENKFIIILIASIAIYAIFLFASDYNKILDKDFNFNLSYILPILSLVTISWIPLILKWHLLLKENDIHVPFKKNILIWLSGSALNTTPGQLGGLIKAQLIKTLYGIPRTRTAPIVLVEKFYGLVGAIIAAIIGIIISGTNFNLALFGFGVLGLLFFFIYYRPVFEFLFNKMTKLKFFSKRSENISGSYKILQISTKPKIASICIGLSLSYWIIISFSVYLVLLAFEINTVSFIQTLSIYTSSVIIGVVSLIPGGIGVTEGSLVGLFTFEGIDISLALVLSVIIRLTTLWYSVSIGFIGLKLTGGLSLSRDLKK